jgi:hypothetical protein
MFDVHFFFVLMEHTPERVWIKTVGYWYIRSNLWYSDM